VVADALADPFRREALDGERELVDPPGGLYGDVVALWDRLQGLGVRRIIPVDRCRRGRDAPNDLGARPAAG
jgi:hypothetical protein